MPSKKKTPPSWSGEYRAKNYKEDEAYREGAKKRSRDNYRKKAWGDTEPTNPIHENMKTLSGFGQVRRIEGRRCKTFTVLEVTQVLARSVSIYRRWISLQQVPAPPHDTVDGGVYKMAEVRAIASVLAGHFDDFNYYRQDHSDTKRAVWEAYWKARDS